MSGGNGVAAIRVHPGIIVIGCMFLGAGSEKVWPDSLQLPQLPFANGVGIGVIVTGLLVWFSAYGAMFRAGTNIDPTRPSTTLVSFGVYAFSRNPIYLGMCLVWTGIGLRKNSLPILVSAALLGALLHFGVVLKEEAYLQQKFGEDYLRYSKAVRRWF